MICEIILVIKRMQEHDCIAVQHYRTVENITFTTEHCSSS